MEERMRLCLCCDETKPIELFPKDSLEGWKKSTCKSCKAEKDRLYKLKNQEKVREMGRAWRQKNKERKSRNGKEWYQKNKEKVKETVRKWREANPDFNKQYIKQWFLDNPTWARDYNRKRNKEDPAYLLRGLLRKRLGAALKAIKTDRVCSGLDLVGCSIPELKAYIESKFKEGMSWSNHGRGGWHIDHIRPCASYDLTDPAQQLECFNYKNLQPLWELENRLKSDKWEPSTTQLENTQNSAPAA